MVDEFRSHTSTKDKMRFICTDSETEKLVDCFSTRKLVALTVPFQKFSNLFEAAFLMTDMNIVYFQLTKSVFPQAK